MEDTWDTRFRDSTTFWVQIVFIPIVAILGAIGNSTTIYILSRKQMHISPKVYLTALTMSDLIFLLSTFFLSLKHYDCIKSVQLYWQYIPFGGWITDAAIYTSNWLTVAFTIERYLAICHPIQTKCYSPSPERRSAIVAGCVYLSCFLLTASKPFEWDTIFQNPVNLTLTNSTVSALESTAYVNNAFYRQIYCFFSTALFVFLPLAILIVCNVLLINAVRASQKIRQSLASCCFHRLQAQTMRQKNRITMNLIVIIIAFSICQLPAAALLIYTSIHTPLKDSAEENVLLGLGNIFNLLIALNAESNFILYTANSRTFKQSFFELFQVNLVLRWWNTWKYNIRNIWTICSFEQTLRKRNQNNSTKSDGMGTDDQQIFIEISREPSKVECLARMKKCKSFDTIKDVIVSIPVLNTPQSPVSI